MDLYTGRLNAAQNLLRYLEGNGITAVICGGYARDTISGESIRDIDLYVGEMQFAQAVQLLAKDGFKAWPEYQENTEEYLHQSVRYQAEYHMFDGLVQQFGLETSLVNIIGLADVCTVEDVISRFNLGLSQAGIDAKGIRHTKAFAEDFTNEQFTLLRPDWGYEATMKAFVKLQAKYPWPLIVQQPSLINDPFI